MATLTVDPSLTSTGWAVFDNGKVLAIGKVTTKVKDGPESRRLNDIYRRLAVIIDMYDISEIICEDQFVDKNPKTAMCLARVRGVVMLLASQKSVPLILYAPMEIKKVITGKGNSNKDMVRQMVLELFSSQQIVIDTLNEKGKTDDMADAVAIGYTHSTLQTGRLS